MRQPSSWLVSFSFKFTCFILVQTASMKTHGPSSKSWHALTKLWTYRSCEIKQNQNASACPQSAFSLFVYTVSRHNIPYIYTPSWYGLPNSNNTCLENARSCNSVDSAGSESCVFHVGSQKAHSLIRARCGQDTRVGSFSMACCEGRRSEPWLTSLCFEFLLEI